MTDRAAMLAHLFNLPGKGNGAIDRQFARAEARNPLPSASLPSAKERTKEAESLHKRQMIPKPSGAVEPPVCKCDDPTPVPPEDGMDAYCFRCSKRLA